MGEPKPLASLSGLLLARKGAARPAMRRPATLENEGEPATNQEDLGWNDMGYDVDPDPNAPMDHEHQVSRNPLAGAVPDAKPEVRQQQEMIAQQLQAQAEVGFDSLPEDVQEAVEGVQAEEEAEEAPRSVEDILHRKPSEEAMQASSVQAPEQEKPAERAEVSTPAPVAKPVKKVAAPKSKKRAAPGSKGKAAFTLRLDKDRHLKLRLACAVTNRSAQMLVTDALDEFLNNIPEIEQLAARVPTK